MAKNRVKAGLLLVEKLHGLEEKHIDDIGCMLDTVKVSAIG